MAGRSKEERETGDLRIKSMLRPFVRVYIRRALIICHPSSDNRPLGLGVRQAISPWPSPSECSRYPCAGSMLHAKFCSAQDWLCYKTACPSSRASARRPPPQILPKP